ncbi:hypothetical protein LTR36_007768 [Oleoguttula mirabilis]|uniref:Carboxymuconolactone decarboxylase-like domain-containing protein n=1 Tax=Oleoguttula mirabilis TaxID=1507867 RepID=A0AAV9J9V6_9PEZI|nr:hypothetical protein LTR36_007768 [Oleoguttula mirabilis]
MADTRALYEAFSRDNAAVHDAYFTTKLPSTGALIGPWGIHLHTPRLGRALMDFTTALRELPELKAKTREIAILTVCVRERAFYEVYAHSRVALLLGLTDQELNMLVYGLCPESLTGEEKAAYDVARELCTSSGPIAQLTWDTAVVQLGRDGALALVQHIGHYRYLATIERGFDAQVPAEGDRVED